MSGLRCSFCKKSSADVERLITGPNNVAICDECVLICHDVVVGKYDDFFDGVASTEQRAGEDDHIERPKEN